MKRLMAAAAMLASLAGCWSWHPSNNGPPRVQEGRSAPAPAPAYGSPPAAYTEPAPVYANPPPPGYVAPPPR